MTDQITIELEKVENWQLMLRKMAIECEQSGQEELAEMYTACANMFYEVIVSETFNNQKPIFNN